MDKGKLKADGVVDIPAALSPVLFRKLPLAVFCLSPAGDFVAINEAALDLFGYSRGQLDGMQVRDLVCDGQDRGNKRRAHWENLKNCFELKTHRQYITSAGKTIAVEQCSNYITDGSDEYELVVVKSSVEEGGRHNTENGDKEKSHENIDNISIDSKRLELAKKAGKVGVLTIDSDSHDSITDNRWREIHGGDVKNQQDFLQLIHPGDKEVVKSRLEAEEREGGEYDLEYRIITPENTVKWIDARGFVIKDDSGRPRQIVETSVDITEKKKRQEEMEKTLRQKEVLFQEVHHRVKNNLQIISSLLNMQSRTVSEDAKKALEDSRNRVQSMSLIHEHLYQSEDLETVNLKGYIDALISAIISSHYSEAAHKVEFETDIETDIEFTLEYAIPCGLIINELVTNALQHAFPAEQKDFVIGVSFAGIQETDFNYELRVYDNGRGFDKTDPSNNLSLGLNLVETLTCGQLYGVVETIIDDGCEFIIKF